MQNTKIEWADHTFNPWICCTKVGPGCDNCYAEADFDKRRHVVSLGASQPRKRTAPSTWAAPLRWNREAAASGVRPLVFCASLTDVFDNKVPGEWRADLFTLIKKTTHLDWLLLTKRIGNVTRLLAEISRGSHQDLPLLEMMPPPNVWIGATITSQADADRDIPKLLAVPAAKRFLSMEPLLGAVNIKKWLDPWTCSNCGHHGTDDESGPCVCDDCGVKTIYDKSDGSDHCPACGKTDEDDGVGFACPICERASNWGRDYCFKFDKEHPIDWVIVGGESGPNAHPMRPDWELGLRDQCQAAGVPFMFKAISNLS